MREIADTLAENNPALEAPFSLGLDAPKLPRWLICMNIKDEIDMFIVEFFLTSNDPDWQPVCPSMLAEALRKRRKVLLPL